MTSAKPKQSTAKSSLLQNCGKGEEKFDPRSASYKPTIAATGTLVISCIAKIPDYPNTTLLLAGSRLTESPCIGGIVRTCEAH